MSHTVEKQTFVEKRAIQIMDLFNKDNSMDRIAYLKTKLGIEIILNYVITLIPLYIVALFLGVFAESCVFHFTTYLVRKFASGVHAKNNFVCTVLSIIIVVGVPYLVGLYNMPLWSKLLLAFPCLYFLAKYAPRTNLGSLKLTESEAKLQRKRCLMVTCGLILLSLLLSNHFGSLIILGVFTAASFVLPITYKVFRMEVAT